MREVAQTAERRAPDDPVVYANREQDRHRGAGEQCKALSRDQEQRHEKDDLAEAIGEGDADQKPGDEIRCHPERGAMRR